MKAAIFVQMSATLIIRKRIRRWAAFCRFAEEGQHFLDSGALHITVSEKKKQKKIKEKIKKNQDITKLCSIPRKVSGGVCKKCLDFLTLHTANVDFIVL